MSKSAQKFPREKNVPTVLTDNHMGREVLYRIPGQVVFRKGKIEEFSGLDLYVRIDKHWMPAKRHTAVSFVKVESAKPRRDTPYE